MVASVSILRGQIINGSLEIKTRIAIYFNSGFLRPPKMFTEATAKATQYQGTCAINHCTVQSYPPMQCVRSVHSFLFYIVLDGGAVSFLFSFVLN